MLHQNLFLMTVMSMLRYHSSLPVEGHKDLDSLDQAGHHRSEVVRTFAKDNAIELHYLPPYSPNLNPIERL